MERSPLELTALPESWRVDPFPALPGLAHHAIRRRALYRELP